MSDIFNESEVTNEGSAIAPPAGISIPPEAADFVGEGKKYGSVEAALKALPHAQSHISTLEKELKELRDKLSRQAALDETVAALNGNTSKPAATPLDENVLDSVLDRKLKQLAEKQTAEANVADFKSAMASQFGDKAKEVYETKAKELGIPVSELDSLIKKSAVAGKTLFGLKNEGKSVTATPAIKTVNSASLSNSVTSKPSKTVMGGASTNDMLDAWRSAKEAAMAKINSN